MAVLIGDIAQAGSNSSFADGQRAAQAYVAAASGTVDTMKVVIRASAFTTLQLAIYGVDGGGAAGDPAALLGVSNTIPSNTAGTKTATMITPVALTSGLTYWLAMLAVGGYVDIIYTGAATNYDYTGAGAGTSFPDPWGTTLGDAGGGLPLQAESGAWPPGDNPAAPSLRLTRSNLRIG